jgi:hypothetical protein
MNIADQKAATSLLLDAHHRAGHIEPVDDENGQPAYRVTAAGIEWALRIIEQLATPDTGSTT